MPELLLRQALDSFDDLGRPMLELAWNNVDLDVHTLLSFERPASSRLFFAGSARRAP
jgi:hypothetical protein